MNLIYSLQLNWQIFQDSFSLFFAALFTSTQIPIHQRMMTFLFVDNRRRFVISFFFAHVLTRIFYLMPLSGLSVWCLVFCGSFVIFSFEPSFVCCVSVHNLFILRCPIDRCKCVQTMRPKENKSQKEKVNHEN